MGKRNYTHVQALLPEIKAMLAEGKTQREVAEHYGFQDKQVVKRLLERERRKERKLEAGILPRPKGRRGKMPDQETLWQSRRMKSSACRWRTNCCGIFCDPQEGSEAEGKISHHISPQRGIFGVRHVHVFNTRSSVLLCLCPPSGQAEKDAALAEVIAQQRERSFCTYGYRRMWLWLKSRIFFAIPNCAAGHEKYDLLSEIRRRRKWQQMGQQVHRYKNLLNREFHANQPNSKWVTDISYIHTKQGVLYLSMIRDLYDNSIVAYKTGHRANGKPGVGHHSAGYAQGEKEVAVELPPPQRPRVPVYLASIL